MRRSDERRAHHSALTRLVALLGLVDDVNAALAANQLVVAMALAEALEAVADLHRFIPIFMRPKPRLPFKSLQIYALSRQTRLNSITKWWARQGSNL